MQSHTTNFVSLTLLAVTSYHNFLVAAAINSDLTILVTSIAACAEPDGAADPENFLTYLKSEEKEAALLQFEQEKEAQKARIITRLTNILPRYSPENSGSLFSFFVDLRTPYGVAEMIAELYPNMASAVSKQTPVGFSDNTLRETNYQRLNTHLKMLAAQEKAFGKDSIDGIATDIEKNILMQRLALLASSAKYKKD